MALDLSVLMPCHNEMHSIKRNITQTVQTLKEYYGDSFELIVIDDGSSDSTFKQIVMGARDNGYTRFVKLKKNHGKGHALKLGFEHAKGRSICFLDGDLDIHPRFINPFYQVMEGQNADVVIGSKRHPDSMINYPKNRRFLSSTYQLFIKALFDLSITDSQVGLKLFRREVLEDVLPRVLVKKYAFDIELLVNAHRNGYKIIEAPIEMDFMSAVGSDINVQAISRMFIDTCAIFYRSNITHYYSEPPEKVLVEQDKQYIVSNE